MLAFHGGTPVRATPMPPRIGFGPEEEKELMEFIAHYHNLDSDPPNIGLCNKRFSEAFAEFQGGGFSLPVSSDTGAIYFSLASLGLPKGSAVLHLLSLAVEFLAVFRRFGSFRKLVILHH